MQKLIQFVYSILKNEILSKEKKRKVNLHMNGCSSKVVNHLYWCGTRCHATPSGNGKEIKETWLSVFNHIHNVRDGHGEIFPSCEHGPLDSLERRKKRFKPSRHYSLQV